MLNAILAIGRDPVFGLTPGEFIFGVVVVVVILAVGFWILRNLHIL